MSQGVAVRRSRGRFSSADQSEDLSEEEYELIREKLVRLSGIELGENKQVLTKSRLYKRMLELGMSDFSSYLNLLETDPNEVIEFVNCMTTNKTDWFREPRHFSYLVDKILPEFYQKSKNTWVNPDSRQFYIWSAASSTGEEVYSLAMAMKEHLKPEFECRILGTDIDTQVLRKASEAVYRSDHVREQVPRSYQEKYFLPVPGNPKFLRVNPELTKKVKLRKFNLIDGSLPADVKFDVIFLRNVLIYFSRETIQQVILRLIQYLRPGGYLIIGLSESLNGLNLPLVNVSESVYRLEK